MFLLNIYRMANKYNKYTQPASKNITRSQIRWRTIGAVALLMVCLVVVFPSYINSGINFVNNKANLGLPTLPSAGFNLGLDLQGGAHLIYQAKTDKIAGKDQADAVEGVRDVIERRVRGGLGVAEPLVQTTRVGEDYRIIVELPGVTDVNTAIKMIGETPVLEFKEENNEPARDLTQDEQKEMDAYNKTATAKANLALAAVKKGTDFAAVVTQYTEDAQSKNNGGDLGFIQQEVYPEIYAWAKTHQDGEVSQALIKSFDGVNIVKRVAEKDGEKKVSASHILICYIGAEGCDNAQYTKAEAKTKIEALAKTVNATNFTQTAKDNSTEPGAAQSGGDLGSFSKGQMVDEFEKAIWDAKSGTIVGPVETQFGFHLIYKKGEEVTKLYDVARVYIKTKSKTDVVPPQAQWKDTGLSGKQLSRAEVSQNYQTGDVQVAIKFNAEGTKLFADLTGRNVGKPVAIFLDGTPISSPRVNEAITTGDAVITGGFTLTEAKLLAQRLNSGALPVPVELISQQKIDASLGSDSLTKSIYAGLIGFLAVIIFMIVYYRLPGVIAVLALGLYASLSLAIFKVIGVTLTLSGIAGFILSVGMAVDANVLIFERLKEELRLRKSLRTAMEEAFIRSWPSIRDSNITTLISCVFLIWFGGGFVRGFAVTLSIGVLVSMFTAITITRTLMRFVAPWCGEFGNRLFWGYTKDKNLNIKDQI